MNRDKQRAYYQKIAEEQQNLIPQLTKKYT